MMENSRYNLHDDKRFKDELDECYFHPSRKYASEEIKFIARNAMLLLWDMDGIVVHGICFSKSDIAVETIVILAEHLSAVDYLWFDTHVYVLADVKVGQLRVHVGIDDR